MTRLQVLLTELEHQSKTISENKNVSYEAHLRPIIVKAKRAPNAQATLQIVDRHYEVLKSSRPDSQTLNSLPAMVLHEGPLLN